VNRQGKTVEERVASGRKGVNKRKSGEKAPRRTVPRDAPGSKIGVGTSRSHTEKNPDESEDR